MMLMDLYRVRFAKDSSEEAKEMKRKIDKALEPVLSDVSMMEEVYECYLDYMSEKRRHMDASNRKKFLLILFYLFCPAVLIGGAMPRGFRKKIGNLIHAKSATIVTNDTDSLLFLYDHYNDFKQDVDDAFSFISERMNFEPQKR